MNDEVELETIETTHHLERGEAFNRLKENPDFQKVIMDGYLKDKVLASVSLLAVPQISDQGRRPGVMEDLISASNLQYFFKQIEDFYEGAKNPILSDEEEEELAKQQEREGTH
jgi:hypothetical protein